MSSRLTTVIDRMLDRDVQTSRIVNVSDARRIAKATLPAVVFDYIDGAADDESTMHQNEAAFADVVFRPKMGMGGRPPELATTVLGTSISMPLMLAPTGLVRLMHPHGAAGAARAAAGRGTLSVLSTVAGSPVDEVAPAAPGRLWFQLYAAGGRVEADRLLTKAEQSGVDVLVVTIDTPALGNRERDRRHGVTGPLRLDARSAIHLGPQVLLRPRWTARMARDGVRMFQRQKPASRSTTSEPAPSASPPSQGAAGAAVTGPAGPEAPAGEEPSGFGMLSMVASPFTWSDIEWLRERWQGKLVVKGVLGAGDARRAVEAGSDAVVISNHGGRQLDSAPATLRVLPEVVEAVGGRAEVLLDGGVRRGSDVVKAVALGARAVFIGRPYLYALAAGGEGGVEHLLDLFRADLIRTMVLLGCPSVAELGADYLF
jgi:isopentenyl diphosphate isomerase/L-lactate dehydrogenase-like FMN-dependent dehydrogenase